MIHYPYTFRFRLLSLFLISLILLSMMLITALPMYFTHTMKKENELLVNTTLTVIEHNFNYYFEELERFTQMPYYNQEFLDSLMTINSSLYENMTQYEQFTVRKNINYTLSFFLRNTREDIKNTMYITNDLEAFVVSKKSGNISLEDGYDIEQAEWYQETISSENSFVLINAHPQDYIGSEEKVFSVARIIKDPISQKQLGILVVDMDSAILGEMLADLDFGVNSMIVILDGFGEQIYTTDWILESAIDQLSEEAMENITLDETSYQVVMRGFDQLPWKVYVLLSNEDQKSKVSGMYFMGGIITVISVLLVTMVYTVVSRKLTNPLNEMLTIIRQIEEGALNLRFNEAGEDEFAYLRHSLNSMLDHINQLIQREYQVTIEKQTAEFHALQSQIQPHYLYNTLAGFIGLNRLGEREKLERSILNLTKQMRYILEQENMTTIEREMTLLQSYCELQQLRFGERLQFEFNVEPYAETCPIPKLLLQPSVENAIVHGLEGNDQEGHLYLNIRKEKGDDGLCLLIEIIDDGVGFDATELDYTQSVGITNTINRLKLWDERASYTIESQVNVGTRVVIRIPIKGGKR